jgi:1D-myo-inositol 3-kinase
LSYDYTTVGHVTIDVMPDGSRQAGGTALYSALQASRLGLRTLILTQGVPAEIEGLLGAYRSEFDLQIAPARATTTLATSGAGLRRSQRVLAWAGELAGDLRVDSAILHLAPVARETTGRWLGRSGFLGLTPQGLLRTWTAGAGEPDRVGAGDGEQPGDGAGGVLSLVSPSAQAELVVERCDALVLSECERASAARLLAAATRTGATVAITDGGRPGTLIAPDGTAVKLVVAPIAGPHDDLGAGDVFAAAFFVALSEGQSIAAAGAYANAAAAVRIQGSGVEAIGDRAAIEARLRARAPAPGPP